MHTGVISHCTINATLIINVDFDDDDDDDVEANSVKNDVRWPKLRII